MVAGTIVIVSFEFQFELWLLYLYMAIRNIVVAYLVAENIDVVFVLV